MAPGFADQTVIYLPGDVLGLGVGDPASKLLERRGRHGLAQGGGRNKCGERMRTLVGVAQRMPAAGAGHAATKPAWRVRAATNCASNPPNE